MKRSALLLVLPLLVGCASINTDNMVSNQASFGAHYAASVALNVHGGSGAAWLFSSVMSATTLAEAIQRSIEGSKLFQEVMGPLSGAKYVLDVNLKYAASHPGFTVTAWVTAVWSLVERESGTTVWKKELTHKAKATVGEAFDASKRQFIAIERATKGLIEDALTEVGALNLKRP